jgi:hypothetical protein
MQWQKGLTEHHASARTALAYLSVMPDWAHSADGSICYVACVDGLAGATMANKDGIGSMLEAQAWCVIAYSKLLNTEQERVRGALTHTGLEAQRLGELMLGID